MKIIVRSRIQKHFENETLGVKNEILASSSNVVKRNIIYLFFRPVSASLCELFEFDLEYMPLSCRFRSGRARYTSLPNSPTPIQFYIYKKFICDQN